MRIALLAAALLLSSCNAQPPQARTIEEIDEIIDVAEKAISLTQKTGMEASADDTQAAVDELLAALETARDQIRTATTEINSASVGFRGRIDTPLAIEVSACIQSHLIEIADVQRMNDRIRQKWAQDVMGCASKASQFLRTVSDTETVDAVGIAIGTIYPVAMAGRARAGFNVPILIKEYRSANETLMGKLAPKCREWKVDKPAQVTETHYECTAHNGDKAHGTETHKQGQLVTKPMDRESVSAQASRRTSRGVAIAVQPKLEALASTLAAAR